MPDYADYINASIDGIEDARSAIHGELTGKSDGWLKDMLLGTLNGIELNLRKALA